MTDIAKSISKRYIKFKKMLLSKIQLTTLMQYIDKNIKFDDTVKIGFFTPLPPQNTGTAQYALYVYSNIIDKIDFISDINTVDEYKNTLSYFQNTNKHHCVPLSVLDKNYETEVYNLGNSEFHVQYLKRASQRKGEANRYITLCETQICGLLKAFCKETKLDFKKILKKYYPEHSKVIDNHQNIWQEFENHNIYGIRALIDLTGIKHFFVYREHGKSMLLKDIEGTKYAENVIVSVLPVGFEELPNLKSNISLNIDGYSVGSFGIASDMKQTDKLIQAIDLLNEQNFNVTLILAGYSLKKYCKKHPSKNVQTFENLSYNDLLTLMKSVDLVAQLRKFSLGESSGCISECLLLDKKIIAVDNLIEPCLKDFCQIVTSDISVEDLSKVILSELQKEPNKYPNNLLQIYPIKNISKKLIKIIGEHKNVK